MCIIDHIDKIVHNYTKEAQYIHCRRLDVPTYNLRTFFITGIAIFIVTATISFCVAHQCGKILLLILASISRDIKATSDIRHVVIIKTTSPLAAVSM